MPPIWGDCCLILRSRPEKRPLRKVTESPQREGGWLQDQPGREDIAVLLATSLPSNSRQVMPSLGSPTRYFFADSYPQCGAGGRCGCECLWSPDLFSLARHGAGPYGWARLHRGSQVPAGKLLGNKHLQLWLRLAGPWDHGRPLCGAVLASQIGFKATQARWCIC